MDSVHQLSAQSGMQDWAAARVALLLVIVFSAVLIAYRLDEPLWETGHHGFHMSEYPHNARNYLRFGYLDTRLGLVMNYGDERPASGYQYRVDHGFVTPFLISLAYRVFGIHDWTARLVPLIFAALVPLLVYALAALSTHDWMVALLSGTFTAFAPVLTYYGRMPAPHDLAVPICLMIAISYWLWFVSGKRIWFAVMAALLLVGAFTDWIAYFVAPAIGLHYIVFADRRRWRVILLLGLAPLVMFGLYLLWVHLLAGPQSLRTLWSIFVVRSGSEYAAGMPFSYLEYVTTSLQRVSYWCTRSLALLSVFWLAWIVVRAVRRQITASDGLVIGLFAFGVSHNLVLRNLVMVHDFAMIYHLLPALALAAAHIVARLVRGLWSRSRAIASALVSVICIVFMLQAVGVYVDEHSRQKVDARPYYIGRALQEVVSTSGWYIDAADMYNHLGALRTYVTADRPYITVSTVEDYLTLSDDPRYEVVITHSTLSDPLLVEYLAKRFPKTEVMEYSLYLLHTLDADDVRGNHSPATDRLWVESWNRGYTTPAQAVWLR